MSLQGMFAVICLVFYSDKITFSGLLYWVNGDSQESKSIFLPHFMKKCLPLSFLWKTNPGFQGLGE